MNSGQSFTLNKVELVWFPETLRHVIDRLVSDKAGNFVPGDCELSQRSRTAKVIPLDLVVEQLLVY